MYAPTDHVDARIGQIDVNFSKKKAERYTMCQKKESTSSIVTSGYHCYHEYSGFTLRKGLGCIKTVMLKDPEKYVGKNLRGLVVPREDYIEVSADCWGQPSQELGQCVKERECVVHIKEDRVKKDWHGVDSCCCMSHNCNENVTIKFVPKGISMHGVVLHPDLVSANSQSTSEQIDNSGSMLATLFLSLFGVAAFIIFLYFVYTRASSCRWLKRKRSDLEDSPEIQQALIGSANERRPRNIVKDHVELGDVVLADGKMSTVAMATYTDPESAEKRAVVVKTVKDLKTFLLEEDVYMLCGNHHDHMAHYIGSIYEPEIERFSIVLEHYEQGCLEDYLKVKTFTPLEALEFIITFIRGLSFLHSPEVLPNGVKKWEIAHRDIKSRNVLIHADGYAVLADFGVSQICKDNGYPARAYQVGTHRYMAPELLNGMANCNREGLLRADMYAASLVLWEILARTKIDDEDDIGPAVPPYSVELEEEAAKREANFKNEAGFNPIEKFERWPEQYYLKRIVYTDERRPVLREKLNTNPISSELIKTIEDMWYQEEDGRITSQRALHRLETLKPKAIAGTIPVFDHSKFVYS